MPTKIYLVKGDITDMAVDAIVNPANTDLVLGSGISEIIRRKGGERIQDECDRLAPLRLGAATATTGGNLRAIYVIHTASMRPGEKATAESIRLATRQSLYRAEEKAIRSVALPAIGTGAAGFPVGECAQIMMKVVLDHIKMRTSLETIYIVLYDDATLKVFEEVFQKLTLRPHARRSVATLWQRLNSVGGSEDPRHRSLPVCHPVNPTPLKTFLLDTIKKSGAITFEQYMAMCLYHPQYGYYTQGCDRTGMAGDYFTSPDLHPIFARLVARQAAEMWEMLGRPSPFSWVEMGAGRGLFAKDFLSWVKSTSPDFASALDYAAIEPGPKQCALLRERMATEDLAGTVRLLENLEQLSPITGCFFSNELIDAFPVAVVARAGGHLREVYVAAQGEELREKLGPISKPAIAAAVARYANRLEECCRVEMNLTATQWMRSVAEKLARGFVITVDYGDLAKYLYTQDRPQGTLLTYCAHQESAAFFSAPGEIDLTAHVNFSALIDTGKDAGLEFTGFTSQERFLLALGEGNMFADLYEQGTNEVENLKARLKLKRLIHPGGMGNIFKVLIQHRQVASPMLTGLKYGSIGA